jgi:hypothetical protein
MIATILITIPKKKLDPTDYTSQWAEKAYKLAKSLGYNVVALRGENTTYYNVTTALQKYHPKVYLHFGHGCNYHLNGQRQCIVTRKLEIDELLSMSPEELDKIFNPIKLSGCGKNICQLQNDTCQPLCFNDTNIHLLKDSIVYAVACHSAEGLGRCAIQYGVQSYVGYQDLLLFPVDGMKSQDMFGELHLEFLKELLKGYSVGEADDAMRRMEDTYIRLYKDTKWIGLPLIWNMLHREVLGNKNARIYE